MLRWIFFTAAHGELCGMTVEHTEHLLSLTAHPLPQFAFISSPQTAISKTLPTLGRLC